MTVFKEIADLIANDGWRSRPLADSEKLKLASTLSLSQNIKDFIEESADGIGKKHPLPHDILPPISGHPDLTGEGQSANEAAGKGKSNNIDFNYYNKTNYKKIDRLEEMTGFNISWARLALQDPLVDDDIFNQLFRKELWRAIQEAAKLPFSSKDFFYFFAGTLQRLLDPHWENIVNLEEFYSKEIAAASVSKYSAEAYEALLDNKRYEYFHSMVPYVFREYIATYDDDEHNGTYAGIFNLGPTEIPDPKDPKNDTIISKTQFDDPTVKKFWYRVFGSKRYTWVDPSFDRKLANDSLRPIDDIFNLFDLATIKNIEQDIQDNEDIYRDYYSDWQARGPLSLSTGDPLAAGIGLTFEETLKFWQVFVEKYLEGDIDNSLLEELEKEEKEKSDIFIFDPDSCGIPIETKEEDPCIPTCKPNPDAVVLDWTTAPNEQPYLNERTCEFWVPITTNYESVSERPISAIINDNIEPGIKLILDFVGKESTEAAVLSVASQVTADYFVDFRTKSKIKVLIKLPFDASVAVEDKETKEGDEMTDSSQFPRNVVLTAKDIRGRGSMLNITSRAIGDKYSVQYALMRKKGELSGLPQDIELKTEGDRIRRFKKALIDLLRAQNFKFNPTRKKSGVLEAVEIGFKEDYKGIEYIKANNIGCEAVELGTNKGGVVDGGSGWTSFLKKSIVDYQTTLAFIANTPQIYEKVTADSPMTVDSFLKSFYFPRIEQEIGQDLTMTQEFIDENDCNTTEVVANLVRPAVVLGSEVAGAALSFPELWLKSIPQKTCLTLEGKRQQDEKYNILKDIEERAKDADLREIFTGDGIFGDLEHRLDEVENLGELYSEILNKLGVCGLSSLAMDALSCLIKGLGIEDSMAMLVKSFIKNATDREMEKLFFTFHPGLQQFIRDSVAEITSIPLPWEAGYRPGSYQAAGVKYSAEYSSASGSIDIRLEKTERRDPEKLVITTDDEERLKRFRARTKTTIQEQEDKFKSSDPIPSGELDADGNQIMVPPPDRVSAAPGLGPKSFAGPFAHAGSVGTALDNIQDNAIVHLKEAIIKAIEEELISGEALMSFIDKIPGSELLKSTISETLECPFPPLFSPPLDDILKTLELDFCRGSYAITLPLMRKMRARPFMGDISTIIIEAAEEALEQLVAKAMTTILKKILNTITNASCEVLKDAAAIAQDIAGGSDFREIVAENICGDSLNDDELNASLNKLNESLGSLGAPGVPKPTNQDMGDFMDGVSAILNQQELLDLLDGEPTDQAVAYVRQIVDGIPNLAAVLPTDDHIRNLFTGMGKVFDRNKIRDKIRATSYKPISPSICASPEHLSLFSEIRCSILSEKGMTTEECEEQLESLKDRAMLDFGDLANALNQNYFGDLDIFGTPDCPDSGLYPREDPQTKFETQKAFSSTDEVINTVFITELITKGGILNMVLADTNGSSFKMHNEFWVKFFGSPLAEDLGPVGVYVNDSGSAGAGAILANAVPGFPTGYYPVTVASYLQSILAGELDVDFELSEDPNLTLIFDNWEKDFDAPEFLNVDYNYQKDRDTTINMKVYSQDDKFGAPLEFDVVRSYDSDLLENIINLGGSSPNASLRPLDTTNQAYIFGNLVVSGLYDYTRDQIGDINSYCASTLYEYITSKIIEKFAFKISENSRTFDFGYDANSKATIKKLNHEEYGGTEKNPAFYIEPPKYTGWMGIYDKLVPEVECGAEPILNFNSISEKTTEYNDELKDDPRLDIPASCALDLERPFDRIMPRASLAGTDGAIRSTVRLYVMEAFLKGLPSFSLFDPSSPRVYDDTLLSYISAKLREGLLSTGLNFRKPASRERYYYTFLEEVVQNFGKKVDLGMIIPNSAQISAMETINDLQEKWRKPRRKPRITYKKRLRDKWIAQIKEVEPSCLVLLNHYISEQLAEVSELFSKALDPSIPNLESWILGSPTWMVAGAVTSGGPLDVATNPLDDFDPTTEKILEIDDNIFVPSNTGPYATGYFPFILEKYIKIEPPAEDISGAKPEIFGLEYWREYLNTKDGSTTTSLTTKASPSSDTEALIVNELGSWSYGLRISMIMPKYFGGSIDDLNSFDASIAPEDVGRTKSLKFGSDVSNRKYVIPVASVEVPISEKVLTTDIIDQYDINCMASELVNSAQYKTLFNYCFPLQSLLSLVTIYTIETFLLSIGEEWKDKVNKGSQFKKWDKEASFEKTKKNLRRLFEGFYNSRDSNYQDEEAETVEERARKNIKVKKAIPTEADIKWWQKRLQVPKPAEMCEEETE